MRRSLWVALAVLFIPPVCAPALDFELAPKEIQSLTPSAQQAYREGMQALDHVRYDTALERFATAQRMDPSSAAIRFLVAKLAVAEGRKRMGDEAVQRFRKAEKALEEIVDTEGPTKAKPSEIERARKILETVRDLILKQAERDARRMRVGREIVKERAKELYPEMNKQPQEAKAEATPAAQGAQQAPRQPARPPAMIGMMPY